MTGVAETFDDATGLVCAYVLDGTGGGRPVGWDDIEAWTADHGPLWVHLDRTAETGQAWLRGKSGLDPLVVEALLAEETRPRSLSLQGGLLVILRGVNLNPGADPEDMISVRIWVEECRVISTRARRLMAVHDLRERLAAARGPNGPGDFLVLIAGRLIERMGPVIEGLDEAIDALEEELLTHESRDIRHRLGAIRRQAIALRRYLAPQREAMARLQTEEHAWLSVRHKAALRETTDRVIRYIEDLDALRERAAVVQDELMNRLSEHMNRTMYILTVVASIMLPLGFVTGLMGVNLGGIPGSENPWGFTILCAIMAALIGVQVWLFRKLRWL